MVIAAVASLDMRVLCWTGCGGDEHTPSAVMPSWPTGGFKANPNVGPFQVFALL